MQLPLLTGFYKSRSIIASAQRCLNLYPEVNTNETYMGLPQMTAAAQITCYPTPGTATLGELAPGSGIGPGPGRGLRAANNGTLYAVVGSGVYAISPTWDYTLLGVIQPGSNPVSMDDNGVTLVLVDGTTSGYLIDLATNVFSTIVDSTGTFVGADRVDYIDGFFLFNKPGTPEFYCSLAQEVVFDPLYFASKNGYSDNLVTLIVCQRNIWLIGVDTTEIWYDSGGELFPFQINPSNFIQHGCAAKYSVAKQDANIFWLSRDPQGDLVAVLATDYATTPISTTAIQNEWATYARTDDAIGFCYQQLGHMFYVLTFPTADRTWVFDTTTALWHERGTFDSLGVQHRIRANAFAFAYDKSVVLDFANGSLIEMSPDIYTDLGQPIIRERSFPHLLNELKRIIYRKFVADMETGNPQTGQTFAAVSTPVIAAAAGLSIAFTSPPASAITGSNVTFDGTVYLAGSAVQVAFGNSPTTPPSTGWFNAAVTGGTWTIQLTAPAVGSYYVWARQTENTQITAETPFASLTNAPQIVQHVAASANSPNETPVQTLTLTLPNPVTIGNMLIFSNTGGYPQYGDNGGGNDPPTGFTAAATSAGGDNTWFTNMSFKTATSTISPSITIQNAPPGTHFSSQAGVLMEVNGENFSFHAGPPDAAYNSISGDLLISPQFGTSQATESLFWNLFTAEGIGTFGLVGPVGGTILSTINGVSIFEGSNYVGADIAWNSNSPEPSTVSSNAGLTINSPPFIGFQSWGIT